MSDMVLVTVSEICRGSGQKRDQVRYAIRKAAVRPARVAGRVRLFSTASMARVLAVVLNLRGYQHRRQDRREVNHVR